MKTPREFIIEFCDDLKARMLDKFDRGAAEHGDEWGQVQCNLEINAEILDILNYHCIHQAQLAMRNKDL